MKFEVWFPSQIILHYITALARETQIERATNKQKTLLMSEKGRDGADIDSIVWRLLRIGNARLDSGICFLILLWCLRCFASVEVSVSKVVADAFYMALFMAWFRVPAFVGVGFVNNLSSVQRVVHFGEGEMFGLELGKSGKCRDTVLSICTKGSWSVLDTVARQVCEMVT